VVVDGYVRVSKVRGRSGDRFMSPTLQREQIFGWAGSHGARVADVFEDLDQSGARPNRPQLERAIRRIEAGESSGLVVRVAEKSATGRPFGRVLGAWEGQPDRRHGPTGSILRRSPRASASSRQQAILGRVRDELGRLTGGVRLPLGLLDGFRPIGPVADGFHDAPVALS
jgi:hypothetical protein